MAHSNTIILASFSLLITAALAGNPAFADDDGGAAPAPSPSLSPAAAEDLNYLNSIPPKEQKYLDTCSKPLSKKCDYEVESAMVGKAEVVTHDCCTQLVKIGKKCHNHLVTLLVNIPDFKSRAATIKTNSNKVWNDCQSSWSKQTAATRRGLKLTFL